MNIDNLIRKAEYRVEYFRKLYDNVMGFYLEAEDEETRADIRRLGYAVLKLIEDEEEEYMRLVSERDDIEARWRE